MVESEAANETVLCGRYRHYKGGLYEVVGIARHSETLDEMVLYRPIGETANMALASFWVRPKAMFFEDVIVDGIRRARFERLDNA